MSTYPRTGLQRVLAGSVNPVVRVTLLDQDGDAADAVGTLTCSIARADGTVVATDRATTDVAGTGLYSCALTTAEGLTLDVLTATWRISTVTRAISYHRVVGGFMFTVAELAQRAGLDQFDANTLRVERDRITDVIEEYCGAQCPTYDREVFIGYGSYTKVLAGSPVRSVRAIAVDGVTQSLTDVDTDPNVGLICAPFWFSDVCSVDYEHGLDRPPNDLKDAAITAAADRVLREYSTLGARTRSMTNDLGVTQQFSYAGKDHPTGLDEVDAVIMRRAKPRLGIG